MMKNHLGQEVVYLLGGLSIVLFILGVSSLLSGGVIIFEVDVISLVTFNFSVVFMLDWISLTFMGTVLLISSSVVYYSNSYMEGERFMFRFLLLVLLFVISMILVIMSPSLISILLGWDGLGLVSYCLVIYYQNMKAYGAGLLTVLSNRVGDVGLLCSIGLLSSVGSWSIFCLELQNSWFLSLVLFFFMFAGVTKSAQVPFSAWLPAAMAAPTPVSALVHSSTLVTAGVYLFIRFYEIISESSFFSGLLFYVAVITMFMAGLSANFEGDMKKVVALSTLSQLGLMMFILSLGQIMITFFHLITHAMFKALLFLTVGKIIHYSNSSQDLRVVGAMPGGLTFTSVCFHSANLALCGFPFLSGFYSKDLIVEHFLIMGYSFLVMFLVLVSLVFTCLYSIRLSFYVLFNCYLGNKTHSLSDSGFGYSGPMMILLFGAIFSGSSFSWLILSDPVEAFLGQMKVSPLISLILALGLFYLLFSLVGETKSVKFLPADWFILSMWYLTSLSSQGLIYLPLSYGKKMLLRFDLGWSEGIGPVGMYKSFTFGGGFIQYWQMNTMKVYLVVFLPWILYFIF